MSRKTTTTPNKVNAFATTIDKDESGNKLLTCTGVVLWNDSTGERQKTTIQYGVVNNQLATINQPEVNNNTSNKDLNRLHEMWKQYLDAKNRRAKSSHLLENFTQEFEKIMN